MGEFKPMVKMETTEPSVILKLKKGGSAHKKMKHGGDAGHTPMQGKMNGGVMGALANQPALVGGPAAPVQRSRAPSRPSMASRRKAMMAKSPMPVMKKGGKACYAEGGVVASSGRIPVSASKKGAEKYVSNISTGEYATKTSGKTGDVKNGNGGGYKTGGVVLGNGGGYKKGGKACATGGVALGNAGGYKKGGASKKAYANGGLVQDDGKAVSMPQGNKKPSSPVSINRLSGTFKKGGNVSSKKLQNVFMNENATSMKEAKSVLLDKYSPYQKKRGGEVESKAMHQAEMQAINKVGKDLKSHASKAASKAHAGLRNGGATKKYADGGMTTGYKIPMSAPEGNTPDSAYDAVMKAEKSGKKTMINQSSKGKGATSDKERKYSSGMSDSDIDKLINSKEFEKSSSSFIDKKRGGKVGK
jgi:hypothetical protein